MEEKYIVALEIGSSKIKGAIGTVDPQGTLSIKAVEEEKLCDGVRYGCIRNVVETAGAIRNVIERLEMREPGRNVNGVYVSVGGRSLMAQSIEIERRLPREMEITGELIDEMTDDALNYQIHERKIVDVTPMEFRVDNVPANRVVGTFGSHVSARLNLISCRNQLVKNLNHVLDERLRLTVHNMFVRQIAEADLVLYTEEKRQGCMLVDFGAETSTVSIYKNGVLLYMVTIPMGSRNITRDITALNYLEEHAEELKITGGNALSTPEPAALPSNNGQPDFGQINNYVSARAGEIIANINEQIKYAGLTPDKLPGGIILVGRGSKLNGFDRRLENLTTMKVRYGVPVNRLRILDGRINASDHVDVISILAAAAKERDVRECLTRPEPMTVVTEPLYPVAEETPRRQPAYTGQPQQQPAQQPVSQQVQQPQQPQKPTYATHNYPQPQTQTQAAAEEKHAPAPEKKRGFSLWNNVRERLVNLMTEPVEDDDNDNDN